MHTRLPLFRMEAAPGLYLAGCDVLLMLMDAGAGSILADRKSTVVVGCIPLVDLRSQRLGQLSIPARVVIVGYQVRRGHHLMQVGDRVAAGCAGRRTRRILLMRELNELLNQRRRKRLGRRVELVVQTPDKDGWMVVVLPDQLNQLLDRKS